MNENTGAGALDTVLSKGQFDRIFSCLADLAAKLRLMAVLLVDGSGRILAQKIGDGWKDTRLEGLAALAAGSYSASNEIARLLGESARFRMVLHEGERRNLFVCSVTQDFHLAVVFESGTAVGMIRLFTKRAVEQLVPVLSERTAPEQDLGKMFDRNFETLLGEELDRSLTDGRSGNRGRS
ncbi:MAG: roadblock/LC7 domain-containing protein [bacterium]|nr:roadblock/LC7 domain-containing protein [bacterium]